MLCKLFVFIEAEFFHERLIGLNEISFGFVASALIRVFTKLGEFCAVFFELAEGAILELIFHKLTAGGTPGEFLFELVGFAGGHGEVLEAILAALGVGLLEVGAEPVEILPGAHGVSEALE